MLRSACCQPMLATAKSAMRPLRTRVAYSTTDVYGYNSAAHTQAVISALVDDLCNVAQKEVPWFHERMPRSQDLDRICQTRSQRQPTTKMSTR